MAVVLGARMIEVREIAPVVDDTLGIRIGEPHAGERGVLERRLAVRDPSELERVAHPGRLRTDHPENLIALLEHAALRQRL
jgi:hypothetical protein